MSEFKRKQDKEEFVPVWDFETHASYRIPARELAPGMVQVEVEGVDGVVWADASQLRQSEIKHPPFNEEVRAHIREIQQVVMEFYPLPLEEWEEGFSARHLLRERNQYMASSCPLVSVSPP